MAGAGNIRVEFVCALPDRQLLRELEVARGTTLYDAVVLSRISEEFPGLFSLETAVMGVFSRIEADPRARVLQDGDRVEIYRPLLIDPNDSRKARARRARQKRGKPQ